MRSRMQINNDDNNQDRDRHENGNNNNNNNNNGVGTHPACASCKHQRKRCKEECLFAPYFPATRTREFQAVHRVFGVSNVQKFFRNARPEDRQRVAEALVWDAICWQRDPILGPLGEYRRVEAELKLLKGHGRGHGHGQLYLQQNQNVNQSQMAQFANGRGALMCRPGVGLVPRSNATMNVGNIGGGANNNHNSIVVNYGFHESGNVLFDASIPYPSHYVHGTERAKHEEDDVSGLYPLNQQRQQQQQHLLAGFNQQHPQYYFPSGQYGCMNGKTMDGAL